MPLHRIEENSSTALVPERPFLSKKYLRDLRKKCNNWIENFGEALTEPALNRVAISEFEMACNKSNGKPFTFDDGHMRSLHFDKRTMQSAMWVEAPDELAFGYTRCMMGFLLSNATPKHILMIGLGGGSLVKYCHRYLPGTRITVVEIDADVIALRDQFLVPPDDSRLQVIHMDAVQYVAQATDEVDVILLDGFDADGLVSELISDDFYAACKNLLSQQGILVTNMWGDSGDLAALISRMNAIFNHALWWCRSIDSFNLIAFAFNSTANEFKPQLKGQLIDRAQGLDQTYRLELEKLVGRLQTVSGKNLPASLVSADRQESLLSLMYLDEIADKIKDLLVVDELIARTRMEWLETHPGPEDGALKGS